MASTAESPSNRNEIFLMTPNSIQHTLRFAVIAVPMLLLAACASGLRANAPAQPTITPQQAAATFEQLKSLKGSWEADFDENGTPDSEVTYEVIAGDSCVVERLFDGTPHSMVTVFHLDGPRLLCTHYCAAGNQPRMEAISATPNSAAFKMIDVTNLADPNASHMDGVSFDFIDTDHVTTNWSSRDKGAPGEAARFRMTRAKKEPTMETPSHGSDFVILMYEDNNSWAAMPKERQEELMGKYMAWVTDLRTRGIFKSGAPCGSKQVLLAGDASGAVTATDHAPTKDVLTGFFVIRAPSLDEAVAIAKTCPSLTHGERVIVRPATHE